MEIAAALICEKSEDFDQSELTYDLYVYFHC